MKLLGNIVWFIFGGFITSLIWALLGLILCVTIIGIPFGRQRFKAAELYIWPFGKKVDANFSAHPIANTIWLIFAGIFIALSNLFFGVILCITIIGIPFGLQWFKMAKLSLIPFGAKVN